MSCLKRFLDAVKAVQKRLRAGLPPEAVSAERDAKANRPFFARHPVLGDTQRRFTIVAYLCQPNGSQEFGGNVLRGGVLVESQAGPYWI